MSRALLSFATFVTAGSILYLWRRFTGSNRPIMNRLLIRELLIKLRKRFFSTLRQISYIVSSIHTLEGDLQVKKISEIIMRDGGSGQKRLNAIEDIVFQQLHVDRADFEYSCGQYCQEDVQIKLLLQSLQMDIQMSLEGVMPTYNGPLPPVDADKAIRIHTQIMKRRMEIIQKRYLQDASNQECLRLEAQIEDFLQMEGIEMEKDPNEKMFLSVLEHHYRTDALFKEQFQKLQMDIELFIIEVDSRKEGDKVPRQPEDDFRKEERRSIL